MMAASIMQQMGIDPLQVKAAFEKTVADIQCKMMDVDSKLTRILEVSNGIDNYIELLDTRLIRIEMKLETLPVEDIFATAKQHPGVLPELTDGRSNCN